MSGERRNDEKDNKKEEEEEGQGWASTFLKVAGVAAATAAAAGSLYSLLKQPEEVILYVDGSHFPLIPSAGCGGFLSDSSGKWICGFALKLDSKLKLDEVEKEAILSGLRWVKKKGKRKVTVKSDREEAVDTVNSGSPSNDTRVCEIRDLLNSPHWKATLTKITRDENHVADRLAHKAHKLDNDLYQYEEFDDPPQNCVSLLPNLLN